MTDEESERLHAIWKKYIIPKQCRFDIIDLITDIEAERDALRALLADETFIQCKADLNRGHLSHAKYVEERERAALQQTSPADAQP